MACAARTPWPVEIAPDRSSGPSNHSRISRTRANGDSGAGMATGTGGNRDQPVGALADRRIGVPVVDDVVQHDAAIGMHRLIDLGHCAERRDDDRHLVLLAHLQVVLEPRVGPGERSG